ncbi:hypothetical protein [Palleronia sp.]|uniref:hypothetical protein n=1 Tax=Palleronia sp. TaxID=1940284 RepID=UPI0035C7F926
MGEGLYWNCNGKTAFCEPYDDLDAEDAPLWRDAFDNLVETIRTCLSKSWEPLDREWRDRSERVVARNGVHEIWLYEDSYARVHVTFGVREGLDGTDALARHTLDERAEAFFDRLQMTYPLQVRTSAWTSGIRHARRVAA